MESEAVATRSAPAALLSCKKVLCRLPEIRWDALPISTNFPPDTVVPLPVSAAMFFAHVELNARSVC